MTAAHTDWTQIVRLYALLAADDLLRPPLGLKRRSSARRRRGRLSPAAVGANVGWGLPKSLSIGCSLAWFWNRFIR